MNVYIRPLNTDDLNAAEMMERLARNTPPVAPIPRFPRMNEIDNPTEIDWLALNKDFS